MSQSRQKHREYGNISEAFNTECGKIYILKPSFALVVKARMNVKKLIIIFTSIAILLLGGWYIYDINCPYGVYEIEIDSECIRNDSVGNEWYFDYTLEGEPITYGYRIILPLDKITVKTFKATITESDKYPDVSSGSIELLIEDKVTKTMEIDE